MQDEQPDRTVNADERLLDVADSVASGSDVDWASASTAHAGDDLELLEQLKLIDAVARLHRVGAARRSRRVPPLRWSRGRAGHSSSWSGA